MLAVSMSLATRLPYTPLFQNTTLKDLWKEWKKHYKTSEARYKYFTQNVGNIARKMPTCPKALKPNLMNKYMDWSAAELARCAVFLQAMDQRTSMPG